MKHMIGIYIYKLWAANTICPSYFYKLCWNDTAAEKVWNNQNQWAIYYEVIDVQAKESHHKIPIQNEWSFVNSIYIISFRMNETFFNKGKCLIFQIINYLKLWNPFVDFFHGHSFTENDVKYLLHQFTNGRQRWKPGNKKVQI
jgi:hypothetical protein